MSDKPIPEAWSVAVRALCDFTARCGDLDLRFTPAPTALEGMLGHAEVRARRGPGYQAEVALEGHYQSLTVRGRADGYDPERQQLEEIKTYRGELTRMPDNQRQLHWAQARTYGWLLCEKLGLSEIRIALVYFNIATQKETVLLELRDADGLRAEFEQRCRRFLQWARQEARHRNLRNEALAGLGFPYPAFRPGQRELAQASWRCARRDATLLAQAPTGIGKTVGTLFPLMRSMPQQRLDKLYCLSARTPGRGLALDGLRRLQAANPVLPLRVVELVARDKACEHPDRACHGEDCPLARGFYDRLPDARRAAVEHGMLDRAALRAIAVEHQVCPYYLGQEMTRWSDVVVGDYNYYFDTSAMLFAMAQAEGWKVGLLVDEAHNLVERARRMYSAELDPRQLLAARQACAALPAVRRALERISREWSALGKPVQAEYTVTALPDRLLLCLQKLVTLVMDLQGETPTAISPPLLQFCFDAMHLLRLSESFDSHSVFDLTRFDARHKPRLCLRNLIPASFLAPRFAAAGCSILFSATLSPWYFHADLLGLPSDTGWIDVPPPFRAEQLTVRIATDISTRYADREQSLEAISRVMGRQFLDRPGNYLAFFSSYDYLQRMLERFRLDWPAIPTWEQSRNMQEEARETFLAKFREDGEGVGFAVLGGAFSEGIDLPGTRLVGAFIATLGLPQLNPVNQLLASRMEQAFGGGYDYAYFYPGLQKVVQAAGRVIRSDTDTGVLVLMDDRFNEPRARALLPNWWRPDAGPLAAGQPGDAVQHQAL